MPPAYKRQKTIEEQYQKLSQLDHILLRPDSYVGSIEQQKDWLYIYDEKNRALSYKEVCFVPGLYKIFDEILVNAADNFTRDPERMSYIKVHIDEKEGCVSVENNGMSLPIEMHQEHKMYVPEMVFGHLLTSDNYDDDEKKITGGRNGYGAKLTNIFSSRFEIECGDSERHKKYQQTWEQNMRKKGQAKVVAHKGEDYTKVTFWPDLARFGMKKLEKDVVGLMARRCLDVAGTTPKKCKVHLNGRVLEVKDFKEYIELYTGGDEGAEVVYEAVHDRWEVAVAVSEGQFQQVSFVNRIATAKGGTHVAHVADQFTDAILKKVNAKNKGGMELKPYHIKNYLWVFVNCQIENPTFDSQTKETMTLKQQKFGSKCDISDAFINKVLKTTGIVDMVLQWAKAKEEIDLGKTLKSESAGKGKKGKRLLGIPKLEDANLAGGRDGSECTLILTEGDSAKALAVAGLSVIGRDRYGVFPLRGKLLNVRDATFSQTMGNQEIASITKILGVEPKRKYNSTREMRYGHLMVMTDQDYDGSHIKGLIVNLVQHWWPSLFQMRGFMQEFVTPIVKVTRRGAVQQFFTMQEYEQWKEENNRGKGWHIKYYKGLGTSTTQEAKEYFGSIDNHSLDFEYKGDDDHGLIDLAFNKKRADDRKEWINAAVDSEFVDHSKAEISYADFIQKELVQFAKYDVLRSIPSVVDGFKPVQRKILWSAFKRNLKSDTKVAQLAGYVSEQSSYHHGEVSLQGAIVALAQTFVGSNNLNLLTPSGQFGTRLQGGKDAASSRYIYTRLEKIARLVFHPADDRLLKYQVEEGQSIEPVWYIPVIPLLLVNGADGIGTGWSTSLPNYSPRDIITNLKRYLRCQPVQEMCPWWAGFKGSILPSADKEAYDVIGVIEKRGQTLLEITELPIRRWTQDYKETLTQMLPTEGPGSGQIEDFKEYHTEGTVHFVITVTEDQMQALEAAGLEKSFKLRTSVAVSNMVFFDRDGKIRKYESEREILEDFAELRLQYYHKRKEALLRALRQQRDILSEKVRFIKAVISETIKVKNRKRDVLIEDLRKQGFRTIHEITEGDDVDVPGGQEEEAAGEGEASKRTTKRQGGWEYLLGMPLWSLTLERCEDFERQLKQKQAELDDLLVTAPEEMWETDLDRILDELDEIDRRDGANAAEERRLKRGSRQVQGSAVKRMRPGSTGAPPQSAPPAPVPVKLSATSESLREMQERQLARTMAEFPDLFQDVLPERPKVATSGLAAVKPVAVRVGSFARKAAVGKSGRGRGAARGRGRAGGRGKGGRAGSGRGRGRKK